MHVCMYMYTNPSEPSKLLTPHISFAVETFHNQQRQSELEVVLCCHIRTVIVPARHEVISLTSATTTIPRSHLPRSHAHNLHLHAACRYPETAPSSLQARHARRFRPATPSFRPSEEYNSGKRLRSIPHITETSAGSTTLAVHINRAAEETYTVARAGEGRCALRHPESR